MTVWYRYRACDLLTDRHIADLDLSQVTFTRRIGEAGTFQATITISNPEDAERAALVVPRFPEDLSTGPGRTVIHVYRNGAVWGSYLLTAATVSSEGRSNTTISLTGSSLEEYLNWVQIRTSIAPYVAVDQIDIMRDLIDRMQGEPIYDIGLTVQAGSSGVTVDRTYLATDAASYGQRLAELADVEGGFEWMVRTMAGVGGARTREVVWGYPTLGNDDADHVFQMPGNVTSISESIDATRGGTAWQVRGESTNDDVTDESVPLMSDVAYADAYLDAGWPGIDQSVDYSSVRIKETLDAYARWNANYLAGALRHVQATVWLDADSTFSPNNLGDRARLKIVNDWWPVVGGVASFSKSWRVIGVDVTPPERGADQDSVSLTFQEEV